MIKSPFLLLPLVFGFNVALAANAPAEAKQVTIPFQNEKIYSNHHTGLVFKYDMNGNKKIVCKVSNVYKSWLEFLDQGTLRESNTYGDFQTIIFTAKGETGPVTDDIDIFHADVTGSVKINDVENKNYPNSSASCFYALDNDLMK